MRDEPALLSAIPDGLPVDDGWVTGLPTGTVRFPYDGTPVAEAPVGDAALATRAVDAAAAM